MLGNGAGLAGTGKSCSTLLAIQELRKRGNVVFYIPSASDLMERASFVQHRYCHDL